MNNPPNREPRPLPIGAVGPGTQPVGDDDVALEYLAMPSAMQIYRPPVLPEPEEVADCNGGLAVLGALHLLLSGYRVGALPQVMDLARLASRDRQLVLETLGEGEVSIRSTDPTAADAMSSFASEDGLLASGRSRVDASTLPHALERRAQETRLAGVWRVREYGSDGTVRRDVLEVCTVPGFVCFSSFAGAKAGIDLEDRAMSGLMNAPGVLAELNAALESRAIARQTEPVRVINLSLLPQTEADLAYLEQRLGIGSTQILSRGYGNCRITATLIQDLWWVQYFNSDDRLILNTLEVTDVPAAALAAQEDIDDSAERLAEILEALQ